ncbi:MAG: hypothetical protein KatS3mg079_320 [Caloramator sp.]|nr:MAG: hypothetical protein KatS3mg079_320 [Caloramator sp.]
MFQSQLYMVRLEFPEPCLSMSVKPKAKGDEDKISTWSYISLLEEDPTFRDYKGC